MNDATDQAKSLSSTSMLSNPEMDELLAQLECDGALLAKRVFYCIKELRVSGGPVGDSVLNTFMLE